MSGLNVTRPNAQTGQLPTAAPSSNFVTLNPKFAPNTTTPCPCCKQVSLETAYQPPLVIKQGRTGYTLIHCKNPECDGYALTLEHSAFMAAMAAIQEASDE